MSADKPETADAADPYQHTFGPYHNDDWFRHQNQSVLSRVWCIVCGRSATDEHKHRAIGAGGCLEGPFCSYRCWSYWFTESITDYSAEARMERREELEGDE